MEEEKFSTNKCQILKNQETNFFELMIVQCKDKIHWKRKKRSGVTFYY